MKTAQSLHHPNIVETLSVFRGPDDAAPSLVLAFPLAAGDLESFFLGDHDHDEAIISRKGTLCSQFLGLASALAHLHWSPANVIHRAITASNVLVYLDEKTGRLVLKLAGFGQSIGKHDELAWQTGTAAQLATVSYDEPDIVWKFVTGRGSEARRLPEKCNLFSNDVWRLGCVFAQLCFFIVGGSRGVKRFREAIAVEGEDNGFDWLGDGRPAGPRFDDGDWVKKQVLESIEGLGRESREVAQIQIVLCAMLGRRIYRPDDDAVTKYLIKVSILPFRAVLRLRASTQERWCVMADGLSSTRTGRVVIMMMARGPPDCTRRIHLRAFPGSKIGDSESRSGRKI